MKVKALHLYPIKGMSVQNVTSAILLEKGFENDRRYMLVDEEGTFISQRSHPKLTQFYPCLTSDKLEVKFNDDLLTISLNDFRSDTIEVSVFDHRFQSHLVSKLADDWFSDRLDQKVRLVKMTPHNSRVKKLIKGPGNTQVSFADGYPYLILGTASLDLLNSHLDEALMMDRFRPNIVIETTQPHIEDSWEQIEIGKSKMMVIKPCARCPVVTVDQTTGSRSKEPLKTLSSYRKKDNNVYFGANAIRLEKGVIRIGDQVKVL